jgi:hypothetical protein
MSNFFKNTGSNNFVSYSPNNWFGLDSDTTVFSVFEEPYEDFLYLSRVFHEAYGDMVSVTTLIEESYEDAPYLVKVFQELYGLKIATHFDESYIITAGIDPKNFEETYGLKLGTLFTEYYDDKPLPTKAFIEQYFDADLSVKVFQEPYEDILYLSKIFQEKYDEVPYITKIFQEKYDEYYTTLKLYSESWDIPEATQKSFIETYGISGDTIVNQFNEIYPLESLNLVQKQMILPYYLVSGTVVQYTPTASLVVNGKDINFVSVSVEMGLDKYCIIVDVQLPSAVDYENCESLASAVLTIDGTNYNLFVESKTKSASINGYEYAIECLSETAKLDSPYSDPIIKEYSTKVLASVVINEMAAIQGITVDNQLIDWELYPLTFSIQEETPLEVIRRIVNVVGGIIQTKPDGTLLLISEYQVSPKDWTTSTPEGIFSLETNIVQISESPVVNPGYNAFIITNQGSDSKTITLREEDVNSTTKIIKGFQVPFDEANPPTLETSGGPIVTIQREDYPIIEQIPVVEDNEFEWEIVEFLEWTGKTSYPIYEIVEYEWIEEDLGDITFKEEGTLTVDSSLYDAESLLRIKYNTKYWKWTVTGVTDKHTQFFVPVETE